MSTRLLALCLTLWAGTAWADYLAYAVGEQARVPLPERIDSIDAKYLVNLDWGDYDGARSRLAVLRVDNNSSSSSYTRTGPTGTYSWSYEYARQVPVNGIEAIVTDVLNNTGRFRLMERQEIGAVLAEQDFGASGRVAQPSSAKIGKVLGAQYLVQMVITDYEAKTASSNSGIGGLITNRVPALGGVGFKRDTGRVGLNFRLIDAETSEVVYTKQVESLIKGGGITFGGVGFTSAGALGGFMSNYARTPIGQAVIAGINKGVYELVKQIGAAPAEGSVVKVEGNRVWINIGGSSVQVGDVLSVVSEGEELIDPDTGISLGSTESTLGSIRVSQTQDKFSIAERQSGSGFERGNRVVSTAAAPTIEFASKWQKPRRF